MTTTWNSNGRFPWKLILALMPLHLSSFDAPIHDGRSKTGKRPLVICVGIVFKPPNARSSLSAPGVVHLRGSFYRTHSIVCRSQRGLVHAGIRRASVVLRRISARLRSKSLTSQPDESICVGGRVQLKETLGTRAGYAAARVRDLSDPHDSFAYMHVSSGEATTMAITKLCNQQL